MPNIAGKLETMATMTHISFDKTSVPLQNAAYLKPEVIRMFRETGVLSEKELEARNEVKWEI